MLSESSLISLKLPGGGGGVEFPLRTAAGLGGRGGDGIEAGGGMRFSLSLCPSWAAVSSGEDDIPRVIPLGAISREVSSLVSDVIVS